MKINLNDQESEDLINFVNLKLGLFNEKNFLNFKKLNAYKNINRGFPLLLNKNNKFFTSNKNKDYFKVSKTFIKKNIYRIKKKKLRTISKFF